MMRIALIATALLALGACHTIPDPYDPERQKRMDECLKQCGAGTPELDNTAYPPVPSEQTDTRTPCERRCYGIP